MKIPDRPYDGIMAVITDPLVRNVLLIEELTRSERTGKDIGDFAFPAESRDPHESDPFETAGRIFQEEVNILNTKFRSLLCYLDINNLTIGVFHYTADTENDVRIGTATAEVANPIWFSLDQLSSNSVKVRQGVKEVIDVITGKLNPNADIIKTLPRFPQAIK